jgi:carboxymethylenebutenolidase
LFARQGDPQKYTSIPELMSNITAKTPDAQVMSDLDATVAWAASQGADTSRLAITGFCWGGRITWLYSAHNPGVKAGIAWYGRLVGTVSALSPRHPTDLVGELKAPVLGLYGGLDTGIPLETVEAMEKALQEKGSVAAKASEIHVYDNAPHAFHADYRPSYRKEEAADGWQRLLGWLKKNGV